MKKIISIPPIIILSLVVIFFLLSLIPDDSTPTKSEENTIDIETSKNPLPKGGRLLGIAITMSDNEDYMDAYSKAKELGVEFDELPLVWDDIETSRENYYNEYLGIANSFYPGQNTKLVIAINPIDTNNLRVPADLKDKSFDDPEVIERFVKLLDYVIKQTPDVELVSFVIGNEIDVYLGNDKQKWQAYEEFFRQTSLYLKSKKSGLKVGTKITFNSIDKQEAKSINQHSDVVMITYYPLNSDYTVKDISVVEKDFSRAVSLYPSKKIQFLEVGYPSGSHTKSNERKQAEFFVEIFKAWDNNRDSIKAVNLVWLHDIPSERVDYYKTYYGVSDKKFLDYLRTLGFITFEGKPKQSFSVIKKEAELRGW